jgi:caffeoyl-CoA O-methyltransferase
MRLRQIAPDTGHFLAACAPQGTYFEVGTSGGYSALWIALACRSRQSSLITCEVDPRKADLARQTFRMAQVEDVVQPYQDDARSVLRQGIAISFCFIDTEKDLYAELYQLAIPLLVRGGLLVADNAVSHADELKGFLGSALRDPRVDAIIVPIGKGQLLCRRRDG